MCEKGIGGPVDVDNAYYYYALAVDAGVVKAAIHYARMSADPPPGIRAERGRAVSYLNRVINGPAIDPNCRPSADDLTDARRLLALLR
jgi:TPR repeat protein